MRTILLRGTVGLCLLFLSAFSGKTENVNENPSPVKQYVKEHVMPVLLQKRQEFDVKLNETERTELADYREQLALLHKNFHGRWNKTNSDEQQASTPVSDEERQANFKKVQEIMAQVKNIAENHKDELDKIYENLSPQRQQWEEDILNIVRAKKEEAAANPSSQDMQFGYGHNIWGMVKKHNRTMFLLLNPSNVSILSNERQAPYQNISLNMNDESATIYPNPAATEFTLNIPGVTTVEKMVITDMTGKMLVDKENVSPTETFTCSNLSDGVYLIQLYAGGQASTQKLIVNH